MKLKHILLVLSLIAAAVGCVSNSIYLDAAIPMAVILFGLFMIVTVLEKESALYEEQLGLVRKTSPKTKKDKSHKVVAANPVLTQAQSH